MGKLKLPDFFCGSSVKTVHCNVSQYCCSFKISNYLPQLNKKSHEFDFSNSYSQKCWLLSINDLFYFQLNLRLKLYNSFQETEFKNITWKSMSRLKILSFQTINLFDYNCLKKQSLLLFNVFGAII